MTRKTRDNVAEPGREKASVTYGSGKDQESMADKASDSTVSALTLHGMHCDSCARIIERVVAKQEGAQIREFDVAGNRILLEYRSWSQLETIRGVLIAEGKL